MNSIRSLSLNYVKQRRCISWKDVDLIQPASCDRLLFADIVCCLQTGPVFSYKLRYIVGFGLVEFRPIQTLRYIVICTRIRALGGVLTVHCDGEARFAHSGDFTLVRVLIL